MAPIFTAHRRPPAQTRVAVRDQGVGIPPHLLPRLFERFYRVEGAVKGAVGAGLGKLPPLPLDDREQPRRVLALCHKHRLRYG